MNFAFSDNFWYNHKLGQHFFNWFWWHRYWVAIFIYFNWRCFFGFDWLIFEQFIGYTLTWLQNFIDNKLVLRVGESEVDMRLSPIIKMCLIIVFISYSFFWLDHLADVNGGCFSAYL